MANAKRVISVIHDEAKLDSCTSMAQKIKYLATVYLNTDGTVDRGAISRLLNIKYQWVRNVLTTPTKK